MEHSNDPSKKRKSDPSSWKRNVVKKKRKSGLSYQNSKGVLIPAKTTGSNSCKCNRECMTSLSLDQQMEVLDRFLGLNTKDEQDVFLQNLIRRSPANRKRHHEGQQPLPRTVLSYNVLVGDKTIEVCRNAFLSLYSISLKRVKRINKLAHLGVSPKDMRGKQRSANTLSSETLQKMHTFISSFPTEISHYTGTVVKYLDERLDIKTIWKMFNEKHSDCKVGLTTFFNFFKDNFNLKFGQPQVDCCCECEMLNTKIKNSHISDAAKRNAEADLMVHKRRARKFYSKMKLEREQNNMDDATIAIAFDFMQNLTLPKIPIQETFYLRQINVNVFAVHNVKLNTAKFYLYHEGNGKKGPNDVCSFLLDYIDNEIPKSAKVLHLYSDNCAGQNKNHAMTKMLLALVEMKRFESIEQYYPIRGHSFLPCDRDFAQIRKGWVKHDRVYSMRQLLKIILNSSKTVNKFQVKLVQAETTLHFKGWWARHYKKTPVSIETCGRKAKKEDKVYFGISSFHHFTYSSSSPGMLKARNFIDGLVHHTFALRKATLLDLPTAKAYPSGKVPMKQAKVDDVAKLQPYIPEKYRPFFVSLITWPTYSTSQEDEPENEQ